MKVVLATLAACLALTPGQVGELPMSFDSKGELYRLSPEANASAAAFPELSAFDHLEIWQTTGGPVLEIHRVDKSKERRSITEEQIAHVRQQVDACMSRPQIAKLNQEDRCSFLLQQISLALSWYGPAVLAIVEPSDFRWGAAHYLTTSPSCFFIPRYTIRNTEMTPAEAHLNVAHRHPDQ